MVVGKLFESDGRRPGRARLECTRLVEQTEGGFDLPGLRRHAGAIDQQQRAPGPIGGEPGPLRER
jgi:hypothetical protein